ncbi:MAG: hypothetical protein D8H95_14925 [Lachnospiraceae bacterium]|nr:MAG: hypothetical protein D8H95_14925 [Lachnospiraceae bacterium]
MSIISTPIKVEMRLSTILELEDALKQIKTLKENNPNQDIKFEIRVAPGTLEKEIQELKKDVNFLMFQSTLFKEFKRAERTSSV